MRLSQAVPGPGKSWNTKGRGQVTHGLSKSSTYKSWSMMKQRCHNPKAPDYDEYGARNITVCSDWYTFEGFLSDMGIRPDGTTLDRIDADAGYSPDNCRWATPAKQQRNRRCSLGEEDASWIRWATLFAGVSQAVLAEAYEVHPSLVSRVLNGEYYRAV